MLLEQDLDKLPSGMPILVMSHCPIPGVSTILEGGNHTDSKHITNLKNQCFKLKKMDETNNGFIHFQIPHAFRCL